MKYLKQVFLLAAIPRATGLKMAVTRVGYTAIQYEMRARWGATEPSSTISSRADLGVERKNDTTESFNI